MQNEYETLADHLVALLSHDIRNDIQKRYVIGICGCPGSGKTTSVSHLVSLVNQRMRMKASTMNIPTMNGNNVSVQDGDEDDMVLCQMLPMDGFHYYKSELAQFSDPTMAFARRGSPYTFNSEKWRQVLLEVRREAFKRCVRVPSFDHAKGDPIEADIAIDAHVRLVLAEGNYLGLSNHQISEDSEDDNKVWQWVSCTDCFDELWFIDVDVEEAMKRVHRRHMQTGMDSETATRRIVENDRPNAQYIVQSAKTSPQRELITRVIRSEHDPDLC